MGYYIIDIIIYVNPSVLLNGLLCADVPLSKLITHSPFDTVG